MKIKTGLEWLNMLTDIEKKQYKENVKNNPIIDMNFEKYINYKKNTRATAWTFLCGSFVLMDMPQGYGYWKRVLERLENS